MKKIAHVKRKLWKALFTGCGITTAAFIFQACYGTPQDYERDAYVYGVVTSHTTGRPVQGVKVSLKDSPYHDSETDAEGCFIIYIPQQDSLYLHFEDKFRQYGAYSSKDTIIATLGKREIECNVSLNEAE
ncbi:MAG: hypothetical protein LBT48_08885 [Prevotellaceae bacterium]|jgi:hypothetical protein|nr:hypothetical protein [Prevotellaceae bacterium]